MNPLTLSPAFAIDMARAIQVEEERARRHRQPTSHADGRRPRRWTWRPGLGQRHPVTA